MLDLLADMGCSGVTRWKERSKEGYYEPIIPTTSYDVLNIRVARSSGLPCRSEVVETRQRFTTAAPGDGYVTFLDDFEHPLLFAAVVVLVIFAFCKQSRVLSDDFSRAWFQAVATITSWIRDIGLSAYPN